MIKIKNDRGEELLGKRAVISVPVNILREGDIKFAPELPKEKVLATQKVGMGMAMKVILKFSQLPFWPKDMELCICSESIFPQIWVEVSQIKRDYTQLRINQRVVQAEVLMRLSSLLALCLVMLLRIFKVCLRR